MSVERAQTAVIGLGAMGAATCCQLARRGADVIGFDAFDVPNDRGSSGGESRIIRMCYYEHPDYVPLLQRAYELWHELASESQQPVIEITGGLFIGAPAGELVGGSKRAAEEHGLEHEMLGNVELRRRYPQFAVQDDMAALYEPTGGFIRPELAIAAHADLARRHGARLHANEPVTSWDAEGEQFIVTTAARRVRVDALVVCAGAWTAKFAPEFADSLRVTRQPLAWVQPKNAATFALGALPIWALEHDAGGFHYGFPILDASKGMKLARHECMAVVDPDHVEHRPLPNDEATVRPFLREFMPEADGPVRHIQVCMYTSSPDGHFIIDRHPHHNRAFIACGFSGHGFKFATVIGEAMADLAISGRTALPIEFLGAQRLQQGRRHKA